MKINLNKNIRRLGVALVEILFGLGVLVAILFIGGIFVYLIYHAATDTFHYYLPNGTEVIPGIDFPAYDPIGSATNPVLAKVEFLKPS